MRNCPDIYLRRAKPFDAAVIYRLMVQLAKHHGMVQCVLTSPADIDRDLIGPERLCDTFIATSRSGTVSGYACFYPIYSAFPARRALFLEHIHVDPAVRSRGVGRRLLAAVIAHGRTIDCQHIDLHVAAWHTAAQRFYAHAGFVKKNEYLYRYVLDAVETDGSSTQLFPGGG